MPTVSAPTVKESYPQVFNRNITNWQNDVYDKAPSEYDVALKVEDMPDQWFEQSFGIQGVPKPTLRRDLQPFQQVARIKGMGNVIRMLQYGSQLIIEESLIRYGRSADAFQSGTDMLESAKTLMDLVGINLFNNGTTLDANTDFTEADGVQRSFFNTAHVREDGLATYANYSATVVPPNIDTLYSILQQGFGMLRDNAGNFINIGREFRIWTPMNVPSYGRPADQIVAGADDPFTANRAVNTIRQNYSLSHRPLRNLTTSTAWYVGFLPSQAAYPFVMKIGKRPTLTPLAAAGELLPTAMVTSLMVDFGVGKRRSPRGIWRQGA